MKHIVYQAEMEGVTVERVIRDSKFDMGNKHWHTECEIQYILEGNRCFFMDDQTYRVEQGGMAIIDSDQIHKTTTDKDDYHDRILLLVDKEKFADAGSAMGFHLDHFFEKYRGTIQIPKKDQNYVEKLFTDIAAEINRRDEGFQTFVQLKMLELWLYVVRFKQNGTGCQDTEAASISKSQIVYEVAEYIKSNYRESKSLEDISNKFYVDKCYLSRIFKSVTGFTVNEYINIQRIRQAQILLEDTTYSIMEIAEMTGYENVTYFTKIFRKYIETTPLKYRKKRMAYRESIREKSGL